MARQKRTKKRYKDLFENPADLVCGSGGSNGDAGTILFPNGEREIWFKHYGKRTIGMSVRFSAGPAGISVTIQRFTCSPGLTVSGNAENTYASLDVKEDAAEVVVTQYFDSDWAQTFKKWYKDPQNNPCPLNDAGQKAVHPDQ